MGDLTIRGIVARGMCHYCGAVCTVTLKAGEGPMMPVHVSTPQGWGIVDLPEPTLFCGVCIKDRVDKFVHTIPGSSTPV